MRDDDINEWYRHQRRKARVRRELFLAGWILIGVAVACALVVWLVAGVV